MKNKSIRIFFISILSSIILGCNLFSTPFEKWYNTLNSYAEVQKNGITIVNMKLNIKKLDSMEVGFRVKFKYKNEIAEDYKNLDIENFEIGRKLNKISPFYVQNINNGITNEIEYLVLFDRQNIVYKDSLILNINLFKIDETHYSLPLN